MEERAINRGEAVATIKLWQEEGRAVEVRLRFRQGITLTHPGYVTIEPDGRLVVAHVIDSDHFFTTVIALAGFKEMTLIESGSAITLAEPREEGAAFDAATIACRQRD